MPMPKTGFFASLSCAAMLLATAPAGAQENVNVLLDWFAQATHGGYIQAEQEGIGADDDIRITVLDGGPKIQTIPQVASGQAEFGVGYADAVLIARSRGAPVKAVFVQADFVPYDLVYHPDPEVKSPADFKGMKFAVSLGSPYWEWIKKKYGLEGAQELPVTGDLTMFRNDPTLVQQGLSLFLPARLEKEGIAFDEFKVEELGYRPYYVLYTTDKMIEEKPELVKAAVKALKEGWTKFAEDPLVVKPSLMARNSQIAPDIHDMAAEKLIENMLPADRTQIGCMDPARWEELASQLREVNMLGDDFSVAEAYDTSFVSGCKE